MWCPDDTGRDGWDWVGPPSWDRAWYSSPERGGSSSPVKTEPPQIGLLLLFETRLYACDVCRRLHNDATVAETNLHAHVPLYMCHLVWRVNPAHRKNKNIRHPEKSLKTTCQLVTSMVSSMICGTRPQSASIRRSPLPASPSRHSAQRSTAQAESPPHV